MRQKMIIPSLLRRISQPANLALVLGIGGMFSLFRLTTGPVTPTLLELVSPFGLLFAHLALAPIPWQWTADAEGQVRSGRSWPLVLLFNGLWISVLVIGMHALGPRHPRPGPGSGPGSSPPPPDRLASRRPHPDLGFGLLNMAFALVLGWTLASKEAMESREHRMAELLRRSRSRALQNQLDPHVLYNALNSLSELVYEDPLAAEEVITHLADLYRLLTVHGHEDIVTLEQERRLVEAYLAMEQMRLGERLTVHWEWPEWADRIWLPPLLLQPLAENAIKHGISPSDEGGELHIACLREGSEVLLRVRNSGRMLNKTQRPGTGIYNLQARLQLWGNGRFQLEDVDGQTQATLRWIVGGAE